MARRLIVAYFAVVLGPLAFAAAAFALRNLVARRQRVLLQGNGRDEANGLAFTMEEVRAP